MHGWKNRETWLIDLHYCPESIYDLEKIKAELIEEYEGFSPYMKQLAEDVHRIDWVELADAIEQVQKEDEEEDEEEGSQ